MKMTPHTLEGGIETGSYAKFAMRLSCILDFCKVIARLLICSCASGDSSSVSMLAFLSGLAIEATACTG
jgi:hypothetical protein